MQLLSLKWPLPLAMFLKGINGRKTPELVVKSNKWKKKRRFVVSRVLKPEKERIQLSILKGSEVDYHFFFTNTNLKSEAVVLSYEKHSNAVNNIKEAKYFI